MKKLFYSLMTIAALLTAASCQKEFTNSPDPAYGGKPVVTTFNVDLGVATKAVAESALDDGTTVDKLYVAAFAQADGSLVSTSLVGDKVASISNKTATVKLTLSKGQAYDIVFFAMKDGAYDVNFANGPTATFSYKSGVKANDPTLDAFYKKITVASASTTQESVTLKRPFAQINVLSSNAPTAQTISSTMTVKQVPTTFDLLNEAPGATLSNLTFAENAISAPAFGKYADDYTWLAMNFVLPNPDGLVELSFQATQMEAAVTVKNVAVKKNGRTNLVGAIYDLDAEITYTVTVDPVFDEEGEGDLNDTETTIATATTYTEANPLVIDASNGATPASVTLTVNGGDSFTDIEAGADGGTIGASSDDEDVATVAVDKTNNAVTITPVGNGTANITVNTPRYTKAGFTAGSIVIPVQVTGFAVPAVDPELSVTGFPTDPVTAPFTVTLSNNSDGELTITVAPQGAATVAADPSAANTYTVTPAEQENDTEVTVSFATAATAAFNAGEVVGTFTIAGSGGGTEPPTTSTIADIKAAIGTATSSTTFDAPITLGTVIVTGINGGSVYMEDETGGINLYLSGHGLERGKSYTGAVVTKGYIRNGAFQIEDFTITDAVVADATLPAKTLAVPAVDFAQYESQRVKIEGVTFTAAVTKAKQTVSVTQGSDAINVYVIPATTVAAGSVADVYGVVTTYQGAVQLSVLATEDIVVTGQGDQTATISGMPAAKSLAASESFDFSTVVTTNSTAAVSYAITSGSDVVTLSGSTVTVKADAAVGATAVITASVAATEGYTAAEDVTCTITVKDSSTPSGDPTVITKTMKEIQEGNSYTISAGTDVTCYKSFSLDSNITVSTSGEDNCGSFWTAGSDIQWRLYQNKSGDVTITAAKGTIKSVKITFAVTNTGALKNGTAIVESGVAQDVNASSVTYTVGNSATATNGQVRITAIEVTYE